MFIARAVSSQIVKIVIDCFSHESLRKRRYVASILPFPLHTPFSTSSSKVRASSHFVECFLLQLDWGLELYSAPAAGNSGDGVILFALEDPKLRIHLSAINKNGISL